MKTFLTKCWMTLTLLLVGPPALLVFWLWLIYLTWTKDVSQLRYLKQMNDLRKMKNQA